MWVFLSSRLRRWLFMTVALPALGAGAHWLGDRLERTHGPSTASRALHRAGDLARRKKARPRARDGAPSPSQAGAQA